MGCCSGPADLRIHSDFSFVLLINISQIICYQMCTEVCFQMDLVPMKSGFYGGRMVEISEDTVCRNNPRVIVEDN